MAHYIFREQLAIKYPTYGHALWEPNPGVYSAVEVGDVGFIREGKFHRLFNALLSAEHPSHQRFGVPEYHEPLRPNILEHVDSGILSPNDFHSAGVTVHAGGLDFSAPELESLAQVSFSCNRKRGAVLSLPVQAQRKDTIAREAFRQWIVKHIDRWFAFTKQLELGIDQMEDIILVTGCHRTRSSTNVAFFESQADAQVSFGVEVAGNPSNMITWQFSREQTQGAVLNRGPSGTDLAEDQCIFIRGFRVTRLLKILPRQLRGAAEHAPDPDTELKPIPPVTKVQYPV
ncbi:hypothetical protein BJV78DRAFT_1278679 [Lactifluus subvellereus]|nr:hypothetical protein BJV78DRAFT_1278679 [Lactifluus subvellereus]